MATTKISALTAASTIDGSADYFPIVTSSLTATQKINRQVFLGVTGTPADLSTVQTFTNKVIGITNTLTLKDTLFTLQNAADTTKQAKFQLSGITTATTRTYTLPDTNDTIVTLAATQALTNKTLTSPTLTGGTIDNSTITVDSISGHTTPTIVTVGGVQMNNGVVSTASSVTSTSIAVGGVQPQALVTGTGTGWSMQSWTPTWTNITVGNGVQASNYIQIGKIVIARLSFKLGTTSTVGTAPTFTLPVTSVSAYIAGQWLGAVRLVAAVTGYTGYIQWASTTTAALIAVGTSGATASDVSITSTVPNTWALNDTITGTFIYEAA